MNGRTFLDTNVLVYAFEEEDARRDTAEDILASGCVISVQVLNEFTSVAIRKLGMSWEELMDALRAIRTLCRQPLPLTIETHEKALGIVRRHKFHIYDALVIAAALESSCTTLFTEDMRDGQVIGGLTIRNPFRPI